MTDNPAQPTRILDKIGADAYWWNDQLIEPGEVAYEGDSLWPIGALSQQNSMASRTTPGQRGMKFMSFAASKLYAVRKVCTLRWEDSGELTGMTQATMFAEADAAALEMAHRVLTRSLADRSLFVLRPQTEPSGTIHVYIERASIPAKIQALPVDQDA